MSLDEEERERKVEYEICIRKGMHSKRNADDDRDDEEKARKRQMG